MLNNIINVTTLNTVINSIFRAEEHLHDIQVAGEISGFKIFKGHGYFILKDEKSQINCNCFNCAKTYIPKDGESVILRGSVDYYTAGGKLNFNVDSIKPIGKGLLALQLELLRKKLYELGYFDIAHKKQIPLYPLNICVVTSFNGAVIKDIKKTIRAKNSLINIAIKDVKVQGKDAHKDIIEGLKLVDKLGYDVIIIARGGGSSEELMPFNNEELVKAIYDCVTPIISAVGHESDVTLCDEVADYRAATPTAAAEYVAFDEYLIQDYLTQTKQKLRSLIDKLIQNKSSELNNKILLLNSQIKLLQSNYGYMLSDYKTKLDNIMSSIFIEKKNLLDKQLAKLEAYNPLNVLKKGYWYMQKDGEIIKQANQINANDVVMLTNDKCKVKAKIMEVCNEN